MQVWLDFDPLKGDLLARATAVRPLRATRPRHLHRRYMKEISAVSGGNESRRLI